MDQYEKYALEIVSKQDIRFVQLWFVDIDGNLLVQSISPLSLQNAFDEGVLFSADALFLDSLNIEQHSNQMLLKPDAKTFQLLPWRSKKSNDLSVNAKNLSSDSDENTYVARMFCNIINLSGEISKFDCRNIIKNAAKVLDDNNISITFRPQIEFYLLNERPLSTNNIKPVDFGGYYGHIFAEKSRDFRRDIVFMLDKIGINIEYSNHEAGFGQNRIVFSSNEPLEMCDDIITIRTVIKEIAQENGLYVSFMPKMANDYPSCGLCTFFSIHTDDFTDDSIMQKFIINAQKNIGELLSLTINHINSLKRLIIDLKTPKNYNYDSKLTNAFCVSNSQSAQLREIEYRLPGSDTNPYLAFSSLIFAGIHENPQKDDENITNSLNIDNSFINLLNKLKNSKLAKQYYSEEFTQKYYSQKLVELENYIMQITNGEFKYY